MFTVECQSQLGSVKGGLEREHHHFANHHGKYWIGWRSSTNAKFGGKFDEEQNICTVLESLPQRLLISCKGNNSVEKLGNILKVIKINISNEGQMRHKWTSRTSRRDTQRTQHYRFNSPAGSDFTNSAMKRSIQTQHKKLSVNKKGRKGTVYFKNVYVTKDCGECSRLKEVEETWQVNMVLDPRLSAVLQGKKML